MEAVRTFRAKSMPEALAKVKREFGPDAVILGTRTIREGGVRGWVGPVVEITAGTADTPGPAPRVATHPRKQRASAPWNAYGAAAQPDEPENAAPPPTARETAAAFDTPSARRAFNALPGGWDDLRTRLAQAEVAEEIADELLRGVQAKLGQVQHAERPAVEAALRAALAELMPQTGGIALTDEAPTRVALVGPAGAGKTTTVAKLAAQFKMRERRSVALLTLDMERFGAREQMQRYSELLDVPLFAAQTVAGVKDALKQARGFDLLLIDTAGVGRRDHAHFARLATLLRCARPHETHLVLPASMSRTCQARFGELFQPLRATHLLMTHLDETLGFGVVINALNQLSLKLSYLSGGQRIPHDLNEAHAAHVAELVLPARE